MLLDTRAGVETDLGRDVRRGLITLSEIGRMVVARR